MTLAAIQAAHGKVKSGADFPGYVREIKQLGVTEYETFVTDGHTHFKGKNDFSANSEAKYDALEIARESNPGQFKKDLVAHQQGKSDYYTFCTQCAMYGIEKWKVDLEDMTCTYYDLPGGKVLVEGIPGW